MDYFGASIAFITMGFVSGFWCLFKWIAPKTKTTWDDKIVDIVEGIANTLQVDPDELAKKSLGKLKEEITERKKEKK